ncbi:MAG: hypothetical protein QX199_03505 [Methylococcaceae bacterium]
MKTQTKKNNLTAIKLGIVLALGSMSALAAPAPTPHPAATALDSVATAERLSRYPTFEDSERAGLALVESSLSLIAARTQINSIFCGPATYSLNVSAFRTEGTAAIDHGVGNGGADLHAVLIEDKLSGAQVNVDALPGSLLKSSALSEYVGDHQWSNLNNIFVDRASFTILHPQNGAPIHYDEHSIKDYFKRVVTVSGVPQSWEFDWGLEVISKLGFPVAKWTELSWYRQWDGNDGYLRVTKQLLTPGSTGAQCAITYNATGTNNGEFDYTGTVTVYKPVVR